MKKLFVLAPVVVLIYTFNTAHADRTVWYVHPDSALNTIQAGLDSCSTDDIVLVGPGTYYEKVIWPDSQGIHLISESGPELTIIDGSDTCQVITLHGYNIDNNTIIRGFTIQNGEGGWGDAGPAIECWGASPKIIGNIITNNTAGANGAYVITCRACSLPAIISDNIITNNIGGGIVISHQASVVITNNTISNNTYFGGIYYDGEELGGIFGNTISSNEGEGIYVAVPIVIERNTITGNAHGILCDAYDSPTIHNNDIFDNFGYGVSNGIPYITIDAEYNWWGDSTGPYHPDSNPGGLGDSVSDYVDFIPWLYWPGVEERSSVNPVVKPYAIGPTIFAGPLILPKDKICKVFDITGRVVTPQQIKPGIYFIEVDGEIKQKVIKVR